MLEDPTTFAYVLRAVTQADRLTHAGRDVAAIPLLREVIEQPQAGGHIRGSSSSILRWLLLGRYPEDQVPAEVRDLLAIATYERPRHWQTLQLRAYVLAYDGDAAGSLRAVKHARRRSPAGRHPILASSLPDNELLPEVDAAISRTRRMWRQSAARSVAPRRDEN